MPTFTVEYTVRVRELVVATDRDHAAMSAIEGDADPREPITVTDDATGTTSTLQDICEACDQPIWSDQASAAAGELADMLLHEECPDPKVLAGGAAERVEVA